MFFYFASDEGIRHNPETTPSNVASFSLATTVPESRKHLLNDAQTLLFTFYGDKNFFYRRTLTNAPAIIAEYGTPSVISLP